MTYRFPLPTLSMRALTGGDASRGVHRPLAEGVRDTMGTAVPGGRVRSSNLSVVLRVPAFRAIWAAEVLSVAGDQLARLGLTIIVLQRTGSPAWSAGVYALTFLPALLGGVLLGHLADRFPRRTVMVAADLVRAALVTVMAVPGVPLWLLCALVVLVVLAGTPYASAQSALLPDLLPGDLLHRGMTVRQVTAQTAQVAGFGVGGLLVAALSPTAALLLDGLTFVVSAALIRLLVRVGAERPAPATAAQATEPGGALAGLRVVFGHRRRRYLACTAWVIGIFVLPEALAASYAASVGAGAIGTGLLMAADPAGSVVGAVLFSRLVAVHRRDRFVPWLVAGAALPLVLCPLATGITPSVLLWALSGACATACLVHVQSGFVRATETGVRGRAVGVAASGLIAAQGVAILLGGLVAQHAGPSVAVGVGGVAGLLLAGGVLLLGRGAGSDDSADAPAAVPAPAHGSS